MKAFASCRWALSVLVATTFLCGNASGLVNIADLFPSNGGAPLFGWSVSLSSDGTRALVGAIDDSVGGAAYVFDRFVGDSSNWTTVAVLYPRNGTGSSKFGSSVALSDDGSRALVGAYSDDTVDSNAGAAYVFAQSEGAPGNWTELAVMYPSTATGTPNFGWSVAFSANGTRALVGARFDDTAGSQAGAAYVMEQTMGSPTNWTELAVLYPSNGTGSWFGFSVSISSDGMRAFIGAPLDGTVGGAAGAAFVFEQSSGAPQNWTQITALYPSDFLGFPNFGWSLVLSSDGTTCLVGAPEESTADTQAGAAYVFEQSIADPTNWKQLVVLYPSNGSALSLFGFSVALSSNGTRALVGARGDETVGSAAGAAYGFVQSVGTPGNWTPFLAVYPSNGTGFPNFGSSVAFSASGATALVGAPFDDTVDPDAGKVDVFGSCLPFEVFDSNMCETCPTGQIPNANQTTCENCPASHIVILGGTECAACPAGHVPNANRTDCEACPEGTVPDVAFTSCETCPIGETPNANQTICVEDSNGSESVSTAPCLNPWVPRLW